jgi:hypothetical protein
MRFTRLHFALGIAVTTAGTIAACGSNDETPSTFHPDGGPGTVDGSLGDDAGDSGVFHLPDGATETDIPASQIASIQFTPNTWSVTSDGQTPQTKNFLLSITLKAGGTMNVNADSLSFNRPDLANLTAGNPALLTVSGSIAGTGQLQAVYSGLTATATVNVSVAVSTTAGTLPSGAQGALDGVLPSGGTSADGGVIDAGPYMNSDDGGNDGGLGTPIYPTTDTKLTSILYPYNNTVFPLGIDSPLLMWTTPAATDTYKVHIAEEGFTYDYYTTAAASLSKDTGAGATDIQLQIPQAIWDEATASNLGDPMVVTLARYDGTKAYVSVVETWPVAHDSLRGSIYYWAISGANGQTGTGAAHLARIHPGTGATPEYIAGGACIGCHAVSSDGSTLVASPEGDAGAASGTTGAGTGSDVSSYIDGDGRAWATYTNTTADAGALPTLQYQSNQFGGNLAVNNNGKYVVFGAQELHLATTADGKIVPNSNIESLSYTADPTHGWMDPAFSPDGTKLAVIQGSTESLQYPNNTNFYLNDYYENLTGGGLQIVDFANGAFSNLRMGVVQSGAAGGSNTYFSYPSFAPDSATLAFQASDAPDGCHYVDSPTVADCGPTTEEIGSVYITKDGTTSAIRLANLSDPPAVANAGANNTFEPTFNPNARGGYFWVVVSSTRAWGNKKFPLGANGGTQNIDKRLWVAAIDETTGTVDPSHPAFFLQSQELAYNGNAAAPSINMRGFWSLSSCTASSTDGSTGGAAACGSGFECCSGFCEMGTCVNSGSVSCAQVSQGCTTTADCCGNSGGAITCNNGVCGTQIIR